MEFQSCWVVLNVPEKYAVRINSGSCVSACPSFSWWRILELLCLETSVNNLKGLLGFQYCRAGILVSSDLSSLKAFSHCSVHSKVAPFLSTLFRQRVTSEKKGMNFL